MPEQVPGAPHVTYEARANAHGRSFLYFRCALCGDQSMKACVDPYGRGPHWAAFYAHLHGHPEVPR